MKTKSGYVAIIGKPNVGKSTLLNALLKQKLSITTNKPQTTRKSILGILSEEDYQIIFLDTPGILKPGYMLQEKMMNFVFQSVRDADVILFLIDAESDAKNLTILDDDAVKKILNFTKVRKILVINKMDLSGKAKIEQIKKRYTDLNLFDKVIEISATLEKNLDFLQETIINYLPEHPKYFPDDIIAQENERFFVSEIIREKILELYKDEIPYSCETVIEEFKERNENKDFISATIFVERETQKQIIIGKNGKAIKKLGEISRKAIEDFLQKEIFLELRVKVKENWRTNEKFLKYFGYSTTEN